MMFSLSQTISAEQVIKITRNSVSSVEKWARLLI